MALALKAEHFRNGSIASFGPRPTSRRPLETDIVRAGGRRYRCEWIEDGKRCTKSAPQHHRLFADHVKERRDDGDPIDPSNGMCLCGSHHTIKAQRECAKRLGATGGEGLNSKSLKGAPTAWVLMQGFFFGKGEKSTASDLFSHPVSTDWDERGPAEHIPTGRN